MVLRPDVVDAAIASVADDRPLVFLTPRGRPLTQARCATLRRRARRDPAVRPLRGRGPARDRGARHGGNQRRRLRAVRRRTRGAGPAGCRRAAAARGDGRRRQRGGGKLLAPTCWNTPTTPGRPTGRDGACPMSCCPAITRPSPHGARLRPNGSPASGVPTCGTRTGQPLAPRRLPARRRRPKEISTEGPDR